VLTECERTIGYTLGAMIELPRAAVCAASIAKHVDFVSFGTNDLTQMTFGFSRDDARSYIDSYLEQGILAADPFLTIDQEGVGQLMRNAIQAVRGVDLRIKIGVCGEHAGDPESIRFFTSIGVDYVSCSPSRLPVAQLAAAQSTFANRAATKCTGSEVKDSVAIERLAPRHAIGLPGIYGQIGGDHAKAIA
jgi:pyruvate,orthophosphate dikinase